MTFVNHLVAGHHVVAGEPGGAAGVGHAGHGHVLAGHHCLDAGECRSFADVDGFDKCVGMGATQDAAVQQAGRLEVRAVFGPAGYLVRAVMPDRPGADHLVVDVGEHDVGSHCNHLTAGLMPKGPDRILSYIVHHPVDNLTISSKGNCGAIVAANKLKAGSDNLGLNQGCYNAQTPSPVFRLSVGPAPGAAAYGPLRRSAWQKPPRDLFRSKGASTSGT